MTASASSRPRVVSTTRPAPNASLLGQPVRHRALGGPQPGGAQLGDVAAGRQPRRQHDPLGPALGVGQHLAGLARADPGARSAPRRRTDAGRSTTGCRRRGCARPARRPTSCRRSSTAGCAGRPSPVSDPAPPSSTPRTSAARPRERLVGRHVAVGQLIVVGRRKLAAPDPARPAWCRPRRSARRRRCDRARRRSRCAPTAPSRPRSPPAPRRSGPG